MRIEYMERKLQWVGLEYLAAFSLACLLKVRKNIADEVPDVGYVEAERCWTWKHVARSTF
jgi:hypothetical protein